MQMVIGFLIGVLTTAVAMALVALYAISTDGHRE